MPEIYECFFGLAQLTRFFSSNDNEYLKELKNFEEETLKQMAKNRIKLYTDYGYTDEFENIL